MARGIALSGTAERGKVVEIEYIEPGGDIFAVGFGGCLVTIKSFPLIDRCGGTAVHKIGPDLDFMPGATVFLIFPDPCEEFAIAESPGDLAFEDGGIDAGEFKEVLIERAVVVVLTIFLGNGGAAFI